MLPTGKRSNTDLRSFLWQKRQLTGRLIQPAVAVVLGVLWGVLAAVPAQALDLFTLWQQPDIPLQITEGAWVDYRGQTMAGGRRQASITRIACLATADGSDGESWLLEIYPLDETSSGDFVPVAGQGVRMRLSRRVLERQGNLFDAISDVEQWQDGVRSKLSNEQWRNDPLVAVSLAGDFQPQDVQTGSPTTRVIGGVQLLCDSYVFTESDTQSVVLPAGKMTQARSHVVTAAVNPDIPFLGLAYIAEKVTSASRMDPPSKRFPDPIPSVEVEIMELVAFGVGVKPVF